MLDSLFSPTVHCTILLCDKIKSNIIQSTLTTTVCEKNALNAYRGRKIDNAQQKGFITLQRKTNSLTTYLKHVSNFIKRTGFDGSSDINQRRPLKITNKCALSISALKILKRCDKPKIRSLDENSKIGGFFSSQAIKRKTILDNI